MEKLLSIKKRLQLVYGELCTEQFFEKFSKCILANKKNNPPKTLWTEKDVFLITYGDSLLKEGEKPLKTLHRFVKDNLSDAISIVHVLPFFPYSSDDGFSVIDFNQVNPELGTWNDLKAITVDFRLMADLVINHISAQSNWMKQFLDGENPGKNYILTVDENFDTTQVVRPRSSSLLTEFRTAEGVKKVWTTFSSDQIDLDYRNPDLLLAMIDILLSYVQNGVSVIRLDAIAFLWKRSGTSCLHQNETHEIVKIMRDVLDYCVPGTILLTETNVPHKENISYFGNGDEAHMVYQFALPPLLLHALHTGSSRFLTHWAASLDKPSLQMTYFNFTASHDGIGVRPLEGLLPDNEKNKLFEKMLDFGGRINTRRTLDGKDVPYELNIAYFDALKGTRDGVDEFQIQRFISSQIIMMSLQGIPAIYIHSLLGTHNYLEGVAITGQNRSINRRKWDVEELEPLLSNETSDHGKVFRQLKKILKIRRSQPAFHPNAQQQIIDAGTDFFIIHRKNILSEDEIVSISNITSVEQMINLSDLYFDYLGTDLLTGTLVNPSKIKLKPYQTVWLSLSDEG